MFLIVIVDNVDDADNYDDRVDSFVVIDDDNDDDNDDSICCCCCHCC